MFKVVSNVNEAKDQLLKLRKVVSERIVDGVTVYVVDGKDYNKTQMIDLANSVVAFV